MVFPLLVVRYQERSDSPITPQKGPVKIPMESPGCLRNDAELIDLISILHCNPAKR